MSLFSAPKIEAPKEDPSVAAARQRAQAQSENDLTMSVQTDLRRRMQARMRTFGLVPAAMGGMRLSLTQGFTGRF